MTGLLFLQHGTGKILGFLAIIHQRQRAKTCAEQILERGFHSERRDGGYETPAGNVVGEIDGEARPAAGLTRLIDLPPCWSEQWPALGLAAPT
jgi:hypothetical protein